MNTFIVEVILNQHAESLATNEFLFLQSDTLTVRGVSAGEGRVSIGGNLADAIITVSDDEVEIISLCTMALSSYSLKCNNYLVMSFHSFFFLLEGRNPPTTKSQFSKVNIFLAK